MRPTPARSSPPLPQREGKDVPLLSEGGAKGGSVSDPPGSFLAPLPQREGKVESDWRSANILFPLPLREGWRLVAGVGRGGEERAGVGHARVGLRAFTLVEMTVIIAILMLLAAAITPNLIAMQRSRNLKDLEAKIARLPIEARNEAVQTGNPIQIKVDGNSLSMVQAPADGSATTPVKSVDLSNLTVDSVEQNGQPSSTGSWEWTVYPDGSADDCNIQFSESGAIKTLVLPPRGDPQWINGDLPDQTPSTWPAGQLAQRTTTVTS